MIKYILKVINIFAVFLLFTGCNQNKIVKQNDLSKLKLLGPVKFVEVTDYYTNDIENIGLPQSRTTYLFDKNGNILENFFYTSYGQLMSKMVCKYNDSLNITEQTVFESGNVLSSKTLFKYDNLGRLFLKYTYGYKIPKTKIELSLYNKLNQVVEIHELDNNMRDMGIVCKYEYDSNGNRTKCILFDSPGKPHVLMTLTSVYDKSNNEIRAENFFGCDTGTTSYNEWKYDTGNLNIEDVEYDRDGSFISRNIHEYQGFENGNWIEKRTKSEMVGYTFGSPIYRSVTKRKFEFYADK